MRVKREVLYTLKLYSYLLALSSAYNAFMQRAGKQFELCYEHSDLLPRNFDFQNATTDGTAGGFTQ